LKKILAKAKKKKPELSKTLNDILFKNVEEGGLKVTEE